MAVDNEVLRAIKARRSTRKFTPEQVSPELLDILLEAAVYAPSGGNNQSWLFTAIQRADFNFFHNAPTLIIASNKRGYENAMADCALALENIFLAAQSVGLGTCYINQLFRLRNDEGVREYLAELGVPREHVVCSSVAVGFAAQESPVPPRKSDTINIVR